MDTIPKMCYSLGHETPWDVQPTGNEETASHCLTEGRTQPSVDRRKTEILFELGGTLVASLSEEGISWTSFQSGARTPTQVIEVTEAETAANPGKGSSIRRLHNESVDFKTDCQSNRKAFWGGLSSRPCLVVDERIGMELPETRTQSSRARRRSHRFLEESSVVTDKKKRKDLRPIWPFLMSLDFCSFPTSSRPGHRWGRPPSCATAINGIASPLSLRLPFPRIENAWASTLTSTRSILPVWRLSAFFATSSATLKERWCFSGMARPSIDARSYETSFFSKRGFMSFVSRRMHRRSTRQSFCGPTQSMLCPTALQTISENSEHCSNAPFTGSGAPSGCCPPASKPPIFRGRSCVSII